MGSLLCLFFLNNILIPGHCTDAITPDSIDSGKYRIHIQAANDMMDLTTYGRVILGEKTELDHDLLR